MEQNNRQERLDWKNLEFTEIHVIKPPKTLKDAHEKHRKCFSHSHNRYRPSEAQQFFIAQMIRLGGYHGRLIVNGYGQFFPDIRGFYSDGLKIQYKENR